ncbi:MAG: hypothetical protein ACLP5H_22760 [Desulfomonilaceae bacterium]
MSLNKRLAPLLRMVKSEISEAVNIHLRGAGFPVCLFLGLADGKLESVPHKCNDTYHPDSESYRGRICVGTPSNLSFRTGIIGSGVKQYT